MDTTDPDTTEGLAGSPVNENEALMEADETELLEGEERTKSMDSMDGDKESETSKLLNNTEPHPGRPEQMGSGGVSGEPKSPKEFSYAYHFKKKYTFRSDSVYSDVTPMSSAPHQSTSSKNSESRDKSGSLSSLKSPQSKWVSLKKKLGKINTLSSGKSKSSSSSTSAGEEKRDGSSDSTTGASSAAPTSTTSGKPIKSLTERRSLLQRAKTLSILPINSAPKKEKEPPKKVAQPPELFNVGGEMNLIPLEFLIDINDIKRPQ